jgi:hypothetical protein
MQSDRFIIPFPCVVYIKQRATGEYVFSHYCNTRVRRPVPKSMRVRDMQEFARQPSLASVLHKSFFLVLVAGDVAQCVSTANVREKRTRFLYRGSEYARNPSRPVKQCSDFHDDYIPLHFYSSLINFSRGVPCDTTHLEAGVALFPRSIREQDIHVLARWVEHNLAKIVHSSTWITEHSDSYSEHTLSLRTGPRSLAQI